MALLLVASAVWLAVGPTCTVVLDALTAVMAFAMGVQAMAARRIGVGDVTTVVVTSTLAGLMGDNPATGGSASGGLTLRRLLAVTTMGLGAVAGAFSMKASVEVAVGVAGVLTLAAAGLLTVRGIVLRSQQTWGPAPGHLRWSRRPASRGPADGRREHSRQQSGCRHQGTADRAEPGGFQQSRREHPVAAGDGVPLMLVSVRLVQR